MTETIKIAAGSRVVIARRNDEASNWSSRLYVNAREINGRVDGDATLIAAKHSTEAGARRWAAKVLAG
jgi:hypothetical protein